MRAKAPTGRPRVAFTPDMIDAAKRALGRNVYPSRAADELRRALKLGRDKCHDLLAAARAEVAGALAGDDTDPLTAVYLFLESVMADGTVPVRDRLAATGIVRLLGLNRLVREPETDDVDGFLARVLASQLARGTNPCEAGAAGRTERLALPAGG